MPRPDDDALFDPESEARLIGAALAMSGLRPERLPALMAEVPATDFSEPVHARLWAAAGRVCGQGATLTARTLADAMGMDEGFTEWGGTATLYDLWDAGGLHGLDALAASVRDRALRRRTDGLFNARARALADTATSAFDQLAETGREVTALLSQAAPADDSLVPARDAAHAALDEMEQEAERGAPRGMMSGLQCIDYRLGGFRPGWLVVLAGRPSMGKTALARSAAMAAAARNPDRLVVFFALEMDRRELSDRTLSELSHLAGDGIAFKDMSGDTLDPHDRARLRGLADDVPCNLVIDDSAVLSLEHIRRRLHVLARRGPVGLVVVDYLQIMKKPPAQGRNEASVIGEMTQGLKQLARELDLCILLLSQLSRGVEGRDDKRPLLSDLRDSGAIEQDANAVLFCYREHYYLERREPPPGHPDHRAWVTECEMLRRRMDVLAPKVRGGQAGTDRQVYFAEFDHIEDRAGGHD